MVGTYEEKGLYAKAARLSSNFLSTQRPTSPPLTLVPYSAISHGADRYSQLTVVGSSGSGGAALSDDEVIEKSIPVPYTSKEANYNIPYGLEQERRELRHYRLLRDILLSGNYGALNEQLRQAPKAVRANDRTLLLAGMASLLNQRRDKATPSEKTQASIDDFLAASEPNLQQIWAGGVPLRANDLFYLEAGNFFR